MAEKKRIHRIRKRNKLTVEDMRGIAEFNKIVKNYLKMSHILSMEEKETIEKLAPHISELRERITSKEESGTYPHDVVTTKELKTVIEGIEIDISWEEYTSRDGEEDDPQELTFSVNGVNYLSGRGPYAKRPASKVREFFENEILA